MKGYEKPMVMVADGLSEGVYAASGAAAGETSTDCWTVSGRSVQDWNGSHNVFEISAKHSTAVEHISGETTVTIVFNNNITDAYSEFPCSFSGNTATVTRTLLADAYKSGDSVTYKVWAKAADEATTNGLAISSIGITCKHETNVQGKYD